MEQENNTTKLCSICKEYKDLILFSNHKKSKDGKQCYCKSCASTYGKENWYRQSDIEVNLKIKQELKEAKNKLLREKAQAILDSGFNTCSKCGEKKPLSEFGKNTNLLGLYASCKVCKKLWFDANKENLYSNSTEAARKYRKNNKPAVLNRNRLRKLAQLQALPKWANLAKIKEFYIERELISKETGEVYHVDHIVPINSKLVCGLHCEFNLQIILGSENIKKQNKYWPDMP